MTRECQGIVTAHIDGMIGINYPVRPDTSITRRVIQTTLARTKTAAEAVGRILYSLGDKKSAYRFLLDGRSRAVCRSVYSTAWCALFSTLREIHPTPLSRDFLPSAHLAWYEALVNVEEVEGTMPGRAIEKPLFRPAPRVVEVAA